MSIVAITARSIGFKFLARSVVFATPLLLVPTLYAQTKGDPVTVVSHVDIIPDSYMAGSEESAARLFRGEIAASQKDQGLVSYVVFRETGQPNHFTIVETWRDAKVYALHEGSTHTVQFRQGIQPFLGSPFDARMLRELR